jgi:protein-tyrosine-phosphatase
LLQPGAVSGDALYRLPQFVILLVCTGNTCRSPMAEALMRDKFLRRFANSSANGSPVFIASGGLSAYPGGPASVEAQRVIAARGLSLSEHQSRAVTKHALQLADLVLVMTKSHRQALLDSLPEIKSKVHLLSGDSTDVADPFGGTESQYAACADQMDTFLDRWVQQLPDSYFPTWK